MNRRLNRRILACAAAMCLATASVSAQQVIEPARGADAPMANVISGAAGGKPATAGAAAAAPRADAAPQLQRNAQELAGAFPAAQRDRIAQAFIDSFEVYGKLEQKFGWPRNDLAGALAAFVVGNYMVLSGTEVPDAQFVAVANQLRARTGGMFDRQTPAALRALYEQSAMVGTFMVLAQLSQQQQAQPPEQRANLQAAARANLEAVLRTEPERLRIGAQGLTLDRPAAAPAAAPATAALSPLAAGSARQGQLVIAPGGGRKAVRFDLRTGRDVELPRSRRASSYLGTTDHWYASATSGGLVRDDGAGGLSLHDVRTLAEVGAIDIGRLPNTDQPEVTGAVRASPDGRLLLGYWRANYRADAPRLFVIDPRVGVIESGSPLRYKASDYQSAADWLPDGRYVYLAGPRIVVARPGGGIESQAPLPLPPGVDPAGASLRASPDGQHLLLTLETHIAGADYGLLYTVRLDGSGLRQLTRPSDAALRARVRMNHSGSWSPDGRWIAVAARGVNPGAIGAYQSCVPVLVVPADAAMQAIDGVRDPADLKLRVPGQREELSACASVELGWTR